MSIRFATPADAMRRALDLARQGEGLVEPNPMVGAVIVDDQLSLIGEGFHMRFGGPHAEIDALEMAGARARGAALFVTLEPCCHFGKTPPCADAVLKAGIRRVFVAMTDPYPKVAGGGIARLRNAGVDVEVGLLEKEAQAVAAPFACLIENGRPWVHAKWAMTLDGKIATRTGDSKWITNPASRARVHQLRGRMDAIAVGIGTALADDPQLTARPKGPRTALRVVFDRQARLPVGSQLVLAARDVPVLTIVSEEAPEERIVALRDRGVEVLSAPAASDDGGLVLFLLQELGRRGCTNLLVEGGSRLLGSFFDARVIDEVHTFIAPKLIGGAASLAPLAGLGLSEIAFSPQLDEPQIEAIEGDVYVRGRPRWPKDAPGRR